MHDMHNRLARFVSNLNHVDAEGQYDAIVMEVQETFGRFDPPGDGRGTWWELELHDIKAEGVNAEAAIAYWKKTAARKIEASALAALPSESLIAWDVSVQMPNSPGQVYVRQVCLPDTLQLRELAEAARSYLPEPYRTLGAVVHMQCAFNPALFDHAGAVGKVPQ